MKLYKLDLNSVLDKFEKEMFSDSREFEIADALEFELFDKDKDNVYSLQFDRIEKYFVITLVEFKEVGGETEIEESFIEKYPMELYNRQFLISRIVKLMEKLILCES